MYCSKSMIRGRIAVVSFLMSHFEILNPEWLGASLKISVFYVLNMLFYVSLEIVELWVVPRAKKPSITLACIHLSLSWHSGLISMTRKIFFPCEQDLPNKTVNYHSIASRYSMVNVCNQGTHFRRKNIWGQFLQHEM
jgi:hypothetical protein